jgi:hypothetical protein
MARKSSRSARSYVIELAVIVVVLAAIYLFLTNGGPTAFGQWFARVIGAP